jgi:hypothetical protein
VEWNGIFTECFGAFHPTVFIKIGHPMAQQLAKHLQPHVGTEPVAVKGHRESAHRLEHCLHNDQGNIDARNNEQLLGELVNPGCADFQHGRNFKADQQKEGAPKHCDGNGTNQVEIAGTVVTDKVPNCLQIVVLAGKLQ